MALHLILGKVSRVMAGRTRFTVFDLKTLNASSVIPIQGKDPDSIILRPRNQAGLYVQRQKQRFDRD